MTIFFSHIKEEAPLAGAVCEWINTVFGAEFQFFVSTDARFNPIGTKWLQRIDREIREAKAVVVLCSPQSIYRPWINFELGCAWVNDTPIIPICHSGQKPEGLPPPLSMLNALDIDQSDSDQILATSLAEQLEVPHPRDTEGELFDQLWGDALGDVTLTDSLAIQAKGMNINIADLRAETNITIRRILRDDSFKLQEQSDTVDYFLNAASFFDQKGDFR